MFLMMHTIVGEEAFSNAERHAIRTCMQEPPERTDNLRANIARVRDWPRVDDVIDDEYDVHEQCSTQGLIGLKTHSVA